MQTDNQANNEQMNNASSTDRRKRINRMKTAIIVIAIVLLILPTILCIFLGLHVIRLHRQVEKLTEVHVREGLVQEDMGDENIAYAHTINPDLNITPTVQPVMPTEIPAENNIIDENTETNSTKPTDLEQTASNPTTSESENTIQEPENSDSSTIQNQLPSEQISEGEATAQGIYSGKLVYLTFDDGPSIYTDEILDILAEYDAKATFFVIGKTDETSLAQYKRIVEEGHILGMHSYTHKYDKIYNSLEDFDKDFTKLWKLLYDTTGYKPTVYRFPGGSDNGVNKNGMEDFIRYLKEKNIVYYDWNVVNGDATGVDYTVDQLIDNILKDVARKNRSIVLMHDARSKKSTVDSLPELLEQLITGGAQIVPLDEKVKPIQMIKADSIQ